MRADIINKMISLSKTKKDGVYTMKGNYYAVKDGRLCLVSDFNTIFTYFLGFLVKIWEGSQYDVRKKLVKFYRCEE